jgi:spermidine synthase
MSVPPASPLKPRPYELPPRPAECYYVEPKTPESAGDTELTFVENTDPFDRYTYRVQNIVYSGKSSYQSILIADTYNYGRILVLDGAIQSSEDDEALYHELLVQPAMLCHPDPKDVLIIGGGEGATLREVLAHGSVQSATMVDLDREVVELCREHLEWWHEGAFDDPRVRLQFADGRQFVESDESRYDVVIIDVVDMLDNGPAQALYTRQFYQILRRRLRPGGIVVVQGLEFSFMDDKPHVALSRTLKTVFPEVSSYKAFIPSFLSAWGFLIASDFFQPAQWSAESIDEAIRHKLGDWLDHLDGEFLKSCFVHCKETQFALSMPGPILEDGVEFVPPPDVEDLDSEPSRFPWLPAV